MANIPDSQEYHSIFRGVAQIFEEKQRNSLEGNTLASQHNV